MRKGVKTAAISVRTADLQLPEWITVISGRRVIVIIIARAAHPTHVTTLLATQSRAFVDYRPPPAVRPSVAFDTRHAAKMRERRRLQIVLVTATLWAIYRVRRTTRGTTKPDLAAESSSTSVADSSLTTLAAQERTKITAKKSPAAVTACIIRKLYSPS